MHKIWFLFCILGFDVTLAQKSSDPENVIVTKPTPGIAAQKQTKSAIENFLIGKVVTSFPENMLEENIDYSGWNDAVKRVESFVTTNSDYDPLLLAKLAATVSLSDSLIDIISGIKSSKISLTESNRRLTDLSTFLGSMSLEKYEDSKRQDAQSLLMTLTNYLKANAANVQNQLREPGFDIINKSGEPIFVLVVNDAKGLGAGKKIFEKAGHAIKVDHEKSYPKKINIKAKTSVLIFTSEPDNDIYNTVLNDKAILPCEVGYEVAEGTKKTIYVSYTKEKGLLPQTGTYLGFRGLTRSGYQLGNNVHAADLARLCGQ